MEANVNRGYLEYKDEKGSYWIPLGRRTRKCLTVLDKKEGEYVRSLEIDLFTGFVYYSVDNATSGGLSYYYDMTSKKVGHYFIHRYLRTARNHGFTCSELEQEIFEKLPCANWAEELEKLPGWKEAIENRVQNLLLPGKEVVRIHVASGADAAANEDAAANAGAGDKGKTDSYRNLTSVTFLQTLADHPTLRREYSFLFEKTGDRIRLRHRDENFGNEFFGENEEYNLFLTEKEYTWILDLIKSVAGDHGSSGADAGTALNDQDRLLELLPQRDALIMEEVCIHGPEGELARIKTQSGEQKTRAEVLKAALRGLLRREIEIL